MARSIAPARSAAMLALAVALPSPMFAAGFEDVFTQDGVDVWAVGPNGFIHRSFDGGASWTQRTVGSSTLFGGAASGFDVLLVADGGVLWRSNDSGGTFTISIGGGPDLDAVEMPEPLTGFAVGANGQILKTADGGATFDPLPSGTTARLRAAFFSDAQRGWVAGEGGTLLATTDGGASWSALPSGTTRELLAVHERDGTIWAVGEAGTAIVSGDAGASFDPVDLDLAPHIDVRGVWITAGGQVYLTGGGGFVRRSADGGASWTFVQHPLQGFSTDIAFHGDRGWLTDRSSRVVLSTSDGGSSWSYPTGSLVSRNWRGVQGVTDGSVRGSTFSVGGVDQRHIYCLLGATVYRSTNEGETWSPMGTVPLTEQSNAFLVSPLDDDVWVAATSALLLGAGDRIQKTSDGGGLWTTHLAKEFGEYGIPLEQHPDQPNTLFFGPDSDVLQRSDDFGTTWLPHSATPFVSPCDIVVVPGTDGQRMIVGDGVTSVGNGRIYQSNDGGLTFTLQQTVSGSEIPGLGNARLRPGTTFATAWSSGGVLRSIDFGETWDPVHSASSAWGVDIAEDDPDVVIFGQYSSGGGFLALDGGVGPSSFLSTNLSGTNYSFYARDRGNLLTLLGSGIRKLDVVASYTPETTQAIDLTSPDGGEIWKAGSVHTVKWNAGNVAIARIEYRTGPEAPWILVSEETGHLGTFAWTVPATPTNEAAVRLSDAWDDDPEDVSSAVFTIETAVDVGEPTVTTTARLALRQNEPNPFRASTLITFALPERGHVRLEVLDLSGRLVAVLAEGMRDPGVHHVRFDGVLDGAERPLAAGTYFYRLRAGGQERIRKMISLH